jgi:hypothetical protein
MPPPLIQQVEAWAEANQTSRSDAFRRLVELGLKAKGKWLPASVRDVEILPGPCHIVGHGSVPATLWPCDPALHDSRGSLPLGHQTERTCSVFYGIVRQRAGSWRGRSPWARKIDPSIEIESVTERDCLSDWPNVIACGNESGPPLIVLAEAEMSDRQHEMDSEIAFPVLRGIVAVILRERRFEPPPP